MAEEHTLNVPKVESVARERNFIRSAVCELRFPTLLQLEREDPVELQKLLRSAFPHYEKRTALSVGAGPVENQNEHLFRSRGKQWLVVFKSSSIALETEKYTTSKLFFEQLTTVIEAARKVVDSDFFTRVGLRFIDAVPLPERRVEGWINPLLVRPLAEGTFGTVERYFQEIRGRSKHGGYGFRHGVFQSSEGKGLEYILDFDFFAEEVPMESVLNLVREFHEESYSLFHWTLGEKAIAYMGKPIGTTP